MWGKILPELVRFVAKEPFGIRTGALAYGANDVYKSIAMQRELDPAFDKKINAIGASPAAFMLGYMLPAVPWDVPAVLPGWAREIANQGAANVQRRAAGQPTQNIDPMAAVARVGSYLSPVSQDITKLSQLGTQIGNAVLGTPKEQQQRGGPQVALPVVGKVGGTANPYPLDQLTPIVDDSIAKLTQLLNGTKFE